MWRTKPPHGMPKYASWCWWWFQQSVATRSPRSRPGLLQRDRELPRAAQRLAVVRAVEALVGEARDDLAVAEERLRPAQQVRQREREVHHQAVHRAHSPTPSSALATSRRSSDGRRAEALEPERALVEAVQRVLPREADAAVHLDRALARGDRGLGGERLRGGRSERGAFVLLRDAPRGPVDERARELDVGVRLRERMGDGLVRADRLAELLACLRVLDAEVERPLRDAERLGGHRGPQARRLLDDVDDGAWRSTVVDVAVAAAPTRRARVRNGPGSSA